MPARHLAYTTDLTDEEGQRLAPLRPPERAGGRPRKYPLREVLNGLPYGWRAGWAWRLLPHDLPHGRPPLSTFAPGAVRGPGCASMISGASVYATRWAARLSPRRLAAMPGR
jgi:transposase